MTTCITLGVACLVAACLYARPAAAISLPGVAQNAEYTLAYKDNSHGTWAPDYAFNPSNPAHVAAALTYFGSFPSGSPGAISRYFGTAESAVDPFSLMQSVSASAQGVSSAYVGHGQPSLNAEKPVYSMTAYQFYYFKVLGGNPGDLVDVEMTASVNASGSGSYRALAEVGFVEFLSFGPPHTPSPAPVPILVPVFEPAFSAASADGTGNDYQGADSSPFGPFQPFTTVSGSLGGTGTIHFQVPAQTDQALYLLATAWVYDQDGSTASAVADPTIIVSPTTPSYEQYSVVQSSNITPVPEIDPAGFGAALSFVAGSLGWFERRRPKAA